jgi:hypothetical protein
MPTSQQQQQQQLHNPQFNTFNPHAFGRPMSSQQSMSHNIAAQNAAHATQPANQQMHTANTGLTPTSDTANPYGQNMWAGSYYGYQSAQQPQPDQWAAARNGGVFRQG